jgi:hypothetical protein
MQTAWRLSSPTGAMLRSGPAREPARHVLDRPRAEAPKSGFAELAAAIPTSGGEYIYLHDAYGPAVAFLSGRVSFSIVSRQEIEAIS